jgi:crotonobetainyl-CoA:carnitine CoA-transferase CaiB-like acyl-CoA transferase
VSSDQPARGPVLRVVEAAQGVAGPACGRLFAALGHEVIKCEPAAGDYLRGQPFSFAALNADKHSMVAEPGSEAMSAVAVGADVLIIDSSWTGMPAPVAITSLQRQRPGLVIVALTLNGLKSARPGERADSLLAEAYGGLASMIGEPDRRPLTLGGEQAAHAAGFAGFLAAMLGLKRRTACGQGGLADVAVSDVAAYLDWKSDITLAARGAVPRRTGRSGGRWRMTRAADGWVGVVFQPRQWTVLADLIGDTRLAAPELLDAEVRDQRAETWWPAICEWTAARPKREIYERAQRAGLAFGYSADTADLAASPQYRARSFVSPGHPERPIRTGAICGGVPWRFGQAPDLGDSAACGWASPDTEAESGAAATTAPTSVGPLAGLVVLDFGMITAGAATGRLLADYGATVLKVESDDHPDSFRQWFQAGGTTAESPLFASNNAGKAGISIDLKSEAGQALVARLAGQADIVIENFSVGVTQRLGIDFARLAAINPRLIYLSLSSQGQSGPESGYRSYGSTLDLLSGLASVTGYDAGNPSWSSVDVNYPDQLVPLLAAGLAVYCAQQRLAGIHLDIAQREVVSWTLSDRFLELGQTGQVAAPTGNRRAGATPHDIYPCRGEDQWVAVACHTAADRAALTGALGLSFPGEDGSYGWWSDNADLVDAALSGWTQSRARSECVASLTEAGVPAAPVLSARDRADEPHFLDRRVYLPGPERLKGFPFVLDGYVPDRPAPAPRLGQHNSLLGAGDSLLAAIHNRDSRGGRENDDRS